MQLLLKLAWRNTLRNPRRTALTLAVVVFGLLALILAWSVFDGGNNQAIKTITGTFTGHVQVHRKGYADDPSLERTFSDSEVDRQKLLALAGVRAAAPRLQAPVMVSTDAVSRGVLLVGVEPGLERVVTSLHERMSSGQWFADDSMGVIVLGSSLAKALKVVVGDEVAVLTQGLQGSIGAARLRVQGVYDTGNEMVDGLQAFVPLRDAQELLSAGDQFTTVALRLDHYDRSATAVAQMIALLPPELEVEGWEQLLPDVVQKINFHEWVATIVMVMLFGVVLVGVTNTMLMSTMERRREFGVAMALGTPPIRLFAMIMLEGGIIGGLGLAIGLSIGSAIVAYLNVVGIQLAGHSNALQQMPGLSDTLYPYLSLKRMLMLGGSVMLVTLASALYPAIRTSRLQPLAAMKGLASAAGRNRFGGRGSAQALLPMLALRNIGRHPLRSVLTGFGVTFALAVFVFLGSFVTGYYRQIVENSTGFVAGDGQVQHRDYRTQLQPSLALDQSQKLLDGISQLPEVRAASPRALTPGLVSSPKSAEPVQLMGVQPESEKRVTFLYKSIQKGRYLAEDGEHDVVIGRKLAERLGVDVGEKVVVMAQDVKGGMASEAFVVVGLFDTGSHSFDETLAQVSLATLQRMLGLDAQSVTSIAYRAAEPDNSEAAMASVRSLVQQPDATVYTWQELLPEVVQMNTMFKGSLALVMGVVFITIAIVIMNTILMSVLERTREFGTMLAIGTPPGLIVRLVLLEAAAIAVIGTLVGDGIGTVAAWSHSITGMSMKEHAMTGIPGTSTVYPQPSWLMSLGPGLLMPVMVVLISLYPALRAARLEPVRAMKMT